MLDYAEDDVSLATEPQDQAIKPSYKAIKPSYTATRPSHETNVSQTPEETQPNGQASNTLPLPRRCTTLIQQNHDGNLKRNYPHRLNRFVENFHFQMENVSCLKTFVRPNYKGCISLCPRTQFLTKVPVFPVDKQLSCLPRAAIRAKFLFQGIYKLIKLITAYLRKRGIRTIVFLDDLLILGSSIKESKANTQLTLYLLQWLGVTINWEKSMVVPTQSLTFLGLSIDSQTMSLSLPEEKILNIQSKCPSLIRNPTSSAREVASLIGTLEAVCPAIWQAPSTLQRITNTAHKIPTGLSRQLRDTHVPKQQRSQRTSVVAPEHSDRKQRYHQSSCPRAIHNLRCLQSRLKCMLPEPNRKWLVFSGGQRSYQCFRAQCSLSCHQNLSQRQVKHHSVPLHGQLYSCCSRKQQRGNPFPSASRPDSRTMGVVPSKINSDHCSAPTRQTQQRGRQRVESFTTPANGK